MLAMIGAVAPQHPAASPVTAVKYDGDFSVLTYNIKGLPWPIATGRSSALTAISARLREQRAAGSAPHVLLLQEAFTSQARSIAAAAGYRYIMNGPDADDHVGSQPPAPDARWWRGETSEAFVGSGLQIASDFPIISARLLVFPRSACAGYDCLASKGAVLVRLKVPGAPTPVDVIDTHLNSRHASGASDERSDAAYAAQVDMLARFIRRNHDPRLPLIAGGDFNIGNSSPRLGGISEMHNALGDTAHAALPAARVQQLPLPADARLSMAHAKDWQFFVPGSAGSIAIEGVRVPFGRESDGTMLSDHIGYAAVYRLGATAAKVGS